VAASRQGGILVHVDPAESGALVSRTKATPMVMRGREMDGWLYVDVDDVRTKRQLATWVERGAGYARSKRLCSFGTTTTPPAERLNSWASASRSMPIS